MIIEASQLKNIAIHSVFMKNLRHIDILQNVHHLQIASAWDTRHESEEDTS